MRVLLLEDEYTLRISIEEFLEDIGYKIDGFSSSEEAYDAVYENRYDLLLLDVNVPGRSGLELLRDLRDEGVKTPAIFLTSMTEVRDLKSGYEAGCCDYMRKPFDLLELQLRMEQVIRSCYHENRTTIVLLEGLEYDTTHFSLISHGNTLTLSKTEKELLNVLIKYKNQVVSIEVLQEEVWGEFVDPANIRVQINNLRKKVDVEFIQNRRGIGYIICTKG
ncbi:MAG: response regulator transcription factor [Campylobacterales bacterium]|nr:response regulator transcription factor [Campylobacterales bacterium]